MRISGEIVPLPEQNGHYSGREFKSWLRKLFLFIYLFVYLFLAHLSTKCSWPAVVISLCLSSVHCQLFALNDFSSKMARRILK